MNQSILPEKRLINFRLPKDLQQSFDYLCSYQSLSRSTVLINLICEYVNEKKHIIKVPPEISDLNSTSKPQRKRTLKSPIEDQKHRENHEDFWEVPDQFYSDTFTSHRF